jgi:hypothetical protein
MVIVAVLQCCGCDDGDQRVSLKERGRHSADAMSFVVHLSQSSLLVDAIVFFQINFARKNSRHA